MPSVTARCPFFSQTSALLKIATEIEESGVDAGGIIDGSALPDNRSLFDFTKASLNEFLAPRALEILSPLFPVRVCCPVLSCRVSNLPFS